LALDNGKFERGLLKDFRGMKAIDKDTNDVACPAICPRLPHSLLTGFLS
jgi:hypothetical protein